MTRGELNPLLHKLPPSLSGDQVQPIQNWLVLERYILAFAYAQSKHWKTPVLFNSIKHLLYLNESCPHKKLTKKENYSYGLPLLTVTYLRTSRLLIFYLVLVGGRMRLEWIFFEESSRGFNLKLSKSESATSTGIASIIPNFTFTLIGKWKVTSSTRSSPAWLYVKVMFLLLDVV